MSDDSPDMRYILQSRRAPAAVTDCGAGLRAGAGAAPAAPAPNTHSACAMEPPAPRPRCCSVRWFRNPILVPIPWPRLPRR